MRGSTVSGNAASSPTLSVATLSRVTHCPHGRQACALSADDLLFSAGIHDEVDGLLGMIRHVR